MPKQYVLVIDHVPGQGWEAHFDGDRPTLGTGGAGWEARSASTLLAYAANALVLNAGKETTP